MATTTRSTTTVLIYARSATPGDGLARQVEELCTYVRDADWTVTGIVAEVQPEGPSAGALDALRVAPRVLIATLDQLGTDRDTALAEVARLAAAQVQVSIATAKPAPEPDPAQVALIRSICEAFELEQRHQRGQRVRRALAHRREARA